MNLAPDWADQFTILTAPSKRLAKLIERDGTISDYDAPKHFKAHAVRVASLLDIAPLLARLLHDPHSMVVRGEIITSADCNNMRRLAFRDPDTGDEPTLRDVPRRWLALDADGITRPDSTPATDLLACADAVIECLPPAFHRAACIVQATGSHGIKPGCRLRIWYWCDRPMGGAELKRWLRDAPFDASVFNTVQPIYTAAPVFDGGRADHLPYRLIEWPGEDWLHCPSVEELAPPPPKIPETVRPVHVAGSARARLYVDAALAGAQTRISNAKLRHPAILSEACSLARFVHAGLLSSSQLHNTLWAGAVAAGKDDESEIARMVDFGLKHPDDAAIPEGVAHG